MSASTTVESILTALARKRFSRTAEAISTLMISLTVSGPTLLVSLRTVDSVGHQLRQREPAEAPQMNRV